MRATHFDRKIASRTLVQASRPPPGFPAVLPVSNLDLVLGPFTIYLISVYPRPPAGVAAMVSAVRESLPSYLSHFFPFAGRIVRDPATNIPEIECSNAGAELVVADACVPLAAVDFSHVDGSFGLIQIPFDASLPLSVQVVRFVCGGFSLAIGTNHLLADGRALTVLLTAWSELLRTGSLSLEPRHDRSLFRPRSPPRFDPSLDAEFARFTPDCMINPLLTATISRRMYLIDAADVERLRRAASGSRPSSRFLAICAHVWKLLARAVGDSDPNCRMAWIMDGRRRVEASLGKGTMDRYMGNVVSYTSREASVADVLRMPLPDVAAMARAAIEAVSNEERFQQLVDWMELRKEAFKEGGKWTEAVNVGLGSPALIISGLLPFRLDGDFGFGKPSIISPWVRHGRLGSAAMTVVPSPRGDGSWFVGATRLWPRLQEVLQADAEGVFKPVTAESLGFTVPARSQASRL